MNPQDKNLDREGGENNLQARINAELAEAFKDDPANACRAHAAITAALASLPQAGAAVERAGGRGEHAQASVAGAGEVKRWQERVEAAEYNALSTGECLKLAEAEIADLRAQLARQRQGEPVAYADPQAFVNFAAARETGKHGGHHSREWMWANPDAGLVPMYTGPVAAQQEQGDAVLDVIAERRRQVEAEGWTAAQDDRYTSEELRAAALCYMRWKDITIPGVTPGAWPWAAKWWKPTDDRRNLVKATALMLAEIERLDRIALRATNTEGKEQQ